MEAFDLLVVGGGINGAAIARDAAGRGLKVVLVEKDDLAAHTSSASSKLIHGGLRYLERYDFRLVRESLHEREIMLRIAPHLVRPLRFILPDPPGDRPWWMIRLGLWAYDLLAGRGPLPRSRSLAAGDPAAAPLKPGFRLASYWDAWVDDARLVVTNAADAAERGAKILTRTALVRAERGPAAWTATLSNGDRIEAFAIVNAAGPWVADLLGDAFGLETAQDRVRLVKGSHIAVPRLWEGDHAYILQQPDGRVVFALPYGSLSLIGTTDVPVETAHAPHCSDEERLYLCQAANLYFRQSITPTRIVWDFAGTRALHDDGSAEAKDVTRDYRLVLDQGSGPRLLTVFGGKITTARALASEALERLGIEGRHFTATCPLPGGDPDPTFQAWLHEIALWMPGKLLDRLSRAYGTRLRTLIGDARSLAALGHHHGAGLYDAELRYLVSHEFARSADDILWRRTKLGLEFPDEELGALELAIARLCSRQD